MHAIFMCGILESCQEAVLSFGYEGENRSLFPFDWKAESCLEDVNDFVD